LEEEPSGWQPSRPGEVREVFPSLGVIPVLAPIEQEEPALTSEYVRRNFDTHLVSRQFRNQVALLAEESPSRREFSSRYDEFLAFTDPWLEELSVEDGARRIGEGNVFLDLYYREPGSIIPKETAWVGDGMQVWVQLLLHLFRRQRNATIILDEPDVYLHADLQRRLVRLLDR
jgi:hypothetical protein